MGVQYSAISAKLKAMYGRRLTGGDYAELLARNTVPEVCAYLKQSACYGAALKDYDEASSHRGELEVRLRKSLFGEYDRLCTFMNQKQRSFFSLWDMQWEIRLLQHAIRYIFNHEASPQAAEILKSEAISRTLQKRTKIDIEALAASKSLADAARACAGTPYEEPLEAGAKLNLDLFSIGMKLDSLYIETLWRAKNSLENEDKEAFAQWLGTDVDMLNIMWIYRGKKYWKFSNEMIYTYILPVRYRLSADDITEMVGAGDAETFIAYVREKTIYGDLFDSEDGGVFAEENYHYLANKKARYIMSAHPLTMAALFSYINIRELEISNIIIIIEGIRYSMNPENIKKHIRLGGI